MTTRSWFVFSVCGLLGELLFLLGTAFIMLAMWWTVTAGPHTRDAWAIAAMLVWTGLAWDRAAGEWKPRQQFAYYEDPDHPES